jgi:L-alanine-DL-glutamate epimerase-like enolase superfamily enzyme
MRGSARIETWPLRGQFGIARGVSTESHVLHVTLESGGIRAQGEAEAAEYDAAEAELTLAECRAFLAGIPAGYTRETLQRDLPAGRIRNAIDCALWDLEAKRAGVRAWDLAVIEPGRVRTLYTIALDTPEVMAAAALAHADWPWLKVKLGGGAADRDRLAAVRSAAPRAKLLVDANGGWSRDELDALAPVLAAAGVAVIEQPLAPGADQVLADWNGPLPLCADESCTDRASLERLPRGYRYINIKLDKTGGLTEALALAAAAHARGLGVMVGCNLGTSLATAPAMLVARLAEIVDLDSPLLLAADRAPALDYEHDLIHWPEAALWG